MKLIWIVYSASCWKGWKWEIMQPYRIFQNYERGQQSVEKMNQGTSNVKHKLVQYQLKDESESSEQEGKEHGRKEI